MGYIREQLDLALSAKFSSREGIVVLSEKAVPGGGDIGRIILTVVNIGREVEVSSSSHPAFDRSGMSPNVPPLKLNLHLLVSASFKHYSDSLRCLSAVLDFFHAHPVFTFEAPPDLGGHVLRLEQELQSLELQDMNNVWRLQGGRYHPSVVYKLRLAVIEKQ